MQGSEIQTDILLDSLQERPIFLHSHEMVKIPLDTRNKIRKVLKPNFSILLGKKRLIEMHSSISLHPDDVILLTNLVYSSESFKAVESWTPICLPKFNNGGFLYAHISFLDGEICLILISNSKEAFYDLSRQKALISQVHFFNNRHYNLN